MGASAWKYYVPYQANIDRALQDLRDQVFRSGQYYKVRPDRQPKTIEELLEWNSEAGTHSILDIIQISEHPDLAKAAPLSPTELVRYFGTAQPARDILESNPAALNEIQMQRGRWAGTYIIVFAGDSPAEILFFGLSGD